MKGLALTVTSFLFMQATCFGASISILDFTEEPTGGIQAEVHIETPRVISSGNQHQEEAYTSNGQGKDIIIKKSATNTYQHSGRHGGEAQNNIGTLKE